MTAKNPRPLTRPRKGEPNHGKACFQPGSLPVSDLPMQPSLKEQMQQSEPEPAPAFDPKACILCDHVIVQKKVLGNKCKISGALCCNLKSCPIEDRKKRGEVTVPVAKEEIPQRYLPIDSCYDCQNRMEMHELYKPYGMMILPEGKESYDFRGRWVCTEKDYKEIIGDEILSWCPLPTRAYINKDVIAELERLCGRVSKNGQANIAAEIVGVIALLRGDDK